MLHIRNLSKQYGSKVLFENAEAHFGPRSRVALIGPNGAGKSTFFKILLNEEHPDSGEVTRGRGVTLGYLPQEIPKVSDRTVLEECLRIEPRGELDEREIYSLEARGKAILMGMGFKISDFERPYQYTIISNDKSKVWSLVLVRCLGPEPKFLLNGRGEGFNSPLEAAQSINNQLAKERTTSA